MIVSPVTDTAERLGDHLAGSRRTRVPFSRAWDDAVATVRPESDFPLHDARRWFEQGYYRRRVGSGAGRMGMLAGASDRLTVAHAYASAPFEGVKRCGSGSGCDAPRTKRSVIVNTITVKAPKRKPAFVIRFHGMRMGGLCDHHRAEIMAAFERAEYCTPTQVAFGHA